METEFDSDKFSELILYIALRSDNDKRFGAIKLNKILFYSDFNAYRLLGSSITGASYQHLGEGPAPREMLPTTRRMKSEGSLTMELHTYFAKVQQRAIPLRPPNLSIFTTHEIRVVDEVIEEFWELNGTQLSDRSHQEYGWKLTEEHETIPYSAALFSAEPLSQEQIERGQEVAAKLELGA